MTLPLAGLLFLVATSAAAQSPEVSAPPLPSPSPAPMEKAPDQCSAAEALYAQAFDWIIAGEDEQALSALIRVLAACPTHPYAAEMARLARTRLGTGGKLSASLTEEKPTRFARGSVVVYQTIHGATQGALLCADNDCGGRGVLGATLAGAALGAGASWLLTDSGVTPGQAAAINSGTTWGLWYGVAATQFVGGSDIPIIMSSMAVFTGVGAGLAGLARPTAGQVSMANSGGLWTGAVTALFILTADSGSKEAFYGIESVATTAGITTLALLSRSIPVSRSRVLLIDTGGILGGLLGSATVALLGAEGDPILVSAGVGALGGLGFTMWLTRDFDADLSAGPEVTLAPSLMGREGAGLTLVGRF